MNAPEPVIHRDREEARAKLLAKLESQRRIRDQIADPSIPLYAKPFTTYPPELIIADAEWRLRWIDCAPEGANYILAPMQDKAGVPCGGVFSELVGPGKALREAYAARGLHPICGGWYRVREAEARIAQEATDEQIESSFDANR